MRRRAAAPDRRAATRTVACGLRARADQLLPIARLRYTAATTSWTLLWRDRNLRFHIYDLLPPSHSVQDLLAELDRDPTGIFWG